MVGKPGVSPQELDTIRFEFAWPEKLDLEVRALQSQTGEDGSIVKVEQTFTFEARQTGSEIRIEQKGALADDVGKEVAKIRTTEEFRRFITGLGLVYPSFRVSETGDFIGAVDADELGSEVGGAVEAFLTRHRSPQATKDVLLAATRGDTFELRAVELWSQLVKRWKGKAFATGEVVTVEVHDLMSRTLIPASADQLLDSTYEVEDAVPCTSDDRTKECARIHTEAVMGSEAAKNNMKALLAGSIRPTEKVSKASVTLSTDIITEPRTMIPRRLIERRDMRVTVVGEDGEARELSREILKRYEFRQVSE